MRKGKLIHMAKTREKNSVEMYKAVIRRQKKVIRDLQKQANRGNKIKEQLEDRENELAEALLEEELADSFIHDNDTCKSCGKGKLEKIDLGVKCMVVCNGCSYRLLVRE